MTATMTPRAVARCLPAGLVLTCVLLPAGVRAQRPATAFLDLPTQVPVVGVFAGYGRGRMPVLGTVSSFGADVRAGSGSNLAGAGGAALTGGAIEGTGWSLDGVLGRLVREPFPGRFGLGAAGRLVGAYSHAPAATGHVNLLDASAALGVGSFAPTPAGSVEIWAMPRLQLRHTDATVPGLEGTRTRFGPGVSFGLSFVSRANLGVGFNIGGDFLALQDHRSDDWHHDWAFGAALLLLR